MRDRIKGSLTVGKPDLQIRVFFRDHVREALKELTVNEIQNAMHAALAESEKSPAYQRFRQHCRNCMEIGIVRQRETLAQILDERA